MRTRASSSLWRDRGFRRFLCARAVSWAGSAITLVALPMLLYQRTGSAALTALVTAFEALPYLAFGLVAGALADRWSRRRMMVLASALSGLLLLTVPAASYAGILTTGHLLVAAFASSSLAVFFDAAGFGVLTSLVGRDRVASANSICTATGTILGLVGPAAGGLLAATVGAETAIGLDALTFLVASVLLLPSSWRWRGVRAARRAAARRREARRARPRTPVRLGADIAAGLRFIWRHPLVRPLTLLGIGNSLAGGAVVGLLLVVAVERIGLSPHDRSIGLFYAVIGAGALIASVALPRVSRSLPVGWTTLGGLFAGWALMLAWTWTTSLVPALVVLGLWQAANTLVILNGITVRMQVTPDALQARVNTTARMIAWGGQPLGAAIGGALAESYGVVPALAVTSVAVLASFAFGTTTALRRRRLDVDADMPQLV